MICSALVALECGELESLLRTAAAVRALDTPNKTLRVLLVIIHYIFTTVRFENFSEAIAK